MDVRIAARVPITFGTADGSTQHTPLIIGSVGGIETRLVLDTGSEVHILTKELVDQLALAVEPGEEGVDHSGATMPSWSAEDVALTLEEGEVVLRDVVVIPAPAPFPTWGIGGIVSPQSLHPSAVTVIDLARDELILIEGDDTTIVRWLTDRSSELVTLSLERDTSFPTVVVSAAVRPFADLPTLLNTGGKGTEFSRAAVPGLANGVDESLGAGVSGAAVLGTPAGAQTLVIADHDVPIARLAVRETMHDPQGLVGIDVLRGTVLACAGDRRRPVVWQIPPR